MQKLSNIAALAAIIISIYCLLLVATSSNAKADCYKWQQYEQDHALFEVSPQMREYCINKHGIDPKYHKGDDLRLGA
jgi:hypothetical protein